MNLARRRPVIVVVCISVAATSATLLGCARAREQAETEASAPEIAAAQATEPPTPTGEAEQPTATQDEAGPAEPRELSGGAGFHTGPRADLSPEALAEAEGSHRADLPLDSEADPKPATPTPAAGKPRSRAAEPAGAEGRKPEPEQPRASARAQQPSASVAGTEPQPDKPQGVVVIGQIEVVSNVPDPSEVPYDTCVTFIKYRVDSCESGRYDGKELLAVFWGMRDGKLKPAARFSVGQRHRLKIEPFSERSELARVMQADDTNEYSLTPYWVTEYADGR